MAGRGRFNYVVRYFIERVLCMSLANEVMKIENRNKDLKMTLQCLVSTIMTSRNDAGSIKELREQVVTILAAEIESYGITI